MADSRKTSLIRRISDLALGIVSPCFDKRGDNTCDYYDVSNGPAPSARVAKSSASGGDFNWPQVAISSASGGAFNRRRVALWIGVGTKRNNHSKNMWPG
jgi:hypothetical protein